MSWVTIQSPEKVRASKMRLSLSKAVRTGGKLCLSVPSTLAGQLGMDKLDSVDLQLGTAENAGRLRIPLEPGSAFKLTRLKHTVTIRFPTPAGVVPTDAADDVDFERADGAVIVTLPEWARPGYVPPAGAQPDRTANEPPADKVKPGSLELNGNDLIMGAARIKLTRSEAAVMALLVERFGKCVRKQVLHDALYALDPDGGADPKIIDVYIHKLRKIFEQRELGIEIKTHHSAGYELRRAI